MCEVMKNHTEAVRSTEPGRRAGRRHWVGGLIVVLGVTGGVVVRGAAVHTETFSSSAAGWVGAGDMTLSWTNNMLRGQFGSQGIPTPQTGSFVATNTASGGAFAGDYQGEGIQLIGFSFRASGVVPSAIQIRFWNTNSTFFRGCTTYVASTGTWYHFAFSMADRDAGGWVGGTPEGFAEALNDVGWVEVQLTRNGTALQRYYLDDYFVDHLPRGSLQTTGEIQVVWSHLRTNVVYTMESADTPLDPWEEQTSFAATNRVVEWSDASATGTAHRIYKLYFLESN